MSKRRQRATSELADGWAVPLGFGDRLLVARRTAGWTQRQLAAELGTQAASIDLWEHGAQPRNLPQLARSLAELLGVSATWLVWGDDTPGVPPRPRADVTDSRNNATWLSNLKAA